MNVPHFLMVLDSVVNKAIRVNQRLTADKISKAQTNRWSTC